MWKVVMVYGVDGVYFNLVEFLSPLNDNQKILFEDPSKEKCKQYMKRMGI